MSMSKEIERDNPLQPYKQAIKDIRYLLRAYSHNAPTDTLEAISKVVNNKKLRAHGTDALGELE